VAIAFSSSELYVFNGRRSCLDFQAGSHLKAAAVGEPFIVDLDMCKSPRALKKALPVGKSQEFVVLLDSNSDMATPPACFRNFDGLVVIATSPKQSRWHWALKDKQSAAFLGGPVAEAYDYDLL
jgi:hypothetical protein